jgi:squalene synthase HpnC
MESCESLTLAHQHYENFPVASWLLPKRLRTPIALIYAFARTADDLADEGSATPTERLHALTQYQDMFETGGFPKLQAVIAQYQLPRSLFLDLLFAFRQDVTKNRYETFQEVLFYCQHSANPIGRLLLHLHGHTHPEAFKASDAICTGLQLINFLQDIVSDMQERNRCYFPQEELCRWGITDQMLKTPQPITRPLTDFLNDQLHRTQTLFNSGRSLQNQLSGRFGLEIRTLIATATQVMHLLSKRYALEDRCHLHKYHWPRIGTRIIASYLRVCAYVAAQ